MKALLILALVAISTLAHAHGDHSHDHEHDHGDGHSHVAVLTDASFDEEIGKAELTLVEFYAPWCGHCKKLAPEYDKAAEQLHGNDKLRLAKIDCTAEKSSCSKYDVSGYPTLKLFRNDGSKPSEYPGARNADGIVKFMRKQTAPAFVEVDSEAAIKALTGKEVVVVGFFSDASSDEAVAFVQTAKKLRNEYTFAIAAQGQAGALSSEFAGKGVPALVVLKPFGEDKAVYEGDFAEDKIGAFVASEAFPLIGEIGPDNYQKYVERGLPLVWFFLDSKDDAGSTQVKATAGAVAKEFKGKLSFVHLDGIRWADHAKNFGVKGKPPGVVIEDRGKNKNYVFGQEITEDNLRAHVQGFVDGTLAPTVKTQEPPADNSGPVKVVVGKTFDQIVMDNSKDVLVEFYAPWCGHCKSLAPKYEELGKMFANEPTVVIAKVDATENDTPAAIKGFPTLIFYPAGDKTKPVTYSGERTEDAMAKFIRDNATTLKGKSAGAGKGHDDSEL